MSDGDEKTQEPTEHKLREARKKGRVAKSTDVVALSSIFFAVLLLAFMAPHYLQRCFKFFYQLHAHGYHVLDQRLLGDVLTSGMDLWFLLSLPVLAIAGLGAVLGNVSQFGFLYSTHPLKLDVKKLNPIAGVKKLFSKDRMVELLKQLLKFCTVFAVIIFTVKSHIRNLAMLFRLDLGAAIVVIADLISTVTIRVLGCFLIIAIFDYFWQRYSFFKSMRMSTYEVKKEHKQLEGDPLIKQERKRIHQEALEGMSVDDVQNAAVVITNPSHLAIALFYDDCGDEAPRVCAKGRDNLARIIIALATEHSVPVLRNVPLARDLQWIEINDEIPQRLYDSVAEVLLFIEELNRGDEQKK